MMNAWITRGTTGRFAGVVAAGLAIHLAAAAARGGEGAVVSASRSGGWLTSCSSCQGGVKSGCSTGCSSCADQGCGSCRGGLFSRFKHDLSQYDWEQLHPDHCWPEQYSREAMARVRAPLGEQVVRGNQLELTLWTFHFSNEKGKEAILNPSGLARLQYLARKRPYVIPFLSMQTSFDPQLDAKRAVAIVAAANSYSFEPMNWQVGLVNRVPTGLIGPEASKEINFMIGTSPSAPPFYQPPIKVGFFESE
ncbi:MAG: hypothetical protein ACRDD1_12890 [Planctomycetia bacterium]